MRVARREPTVDTVLLERSFTLRLSEEQRVLNKNSKCPRCDRLLLYTTTYEPTGRVRRVLNPTDPLSLAECPRCHQRWFYFEQPLQIEFIEGPRESEEGELSELVLDNRRGTSDLKRKRTVTQEWTQRYEVERENTETVGAKLGANIGAIATLEVTAEQALKERYAVSEEKREVYTEELSFEVPAGVCRKVRLAFKHHWQAGVIRVRLPSSGNPGESQEAEQLEVPFRVMVDVSMDLAQEDTVD